MAVWRLCRRLEGYVAVRGEPGFIRFANKGKE